MNNQQLIHIFTALSKLLNSTQPMNIILNKMMSLVEPIFHIDNWSIFRLDSTSNELFFIATKGIDLNRVSGLRFKLGQGIVGKVAKLGKSVHVKTTKPPTHINKIVDTISGFKTLSLIAVPLKYRKQILGVLEIINPDTKTTPADTIVNVMEIIANFAAIVLAQTFIYQEALLLAQYDQLTGMYNRHKLNLIKNTWSSLQKSKKSRRNQNSLISIVLIDVDDFKLINDTYGHPAGDALLKIIADGLKKCFRGSDLLFRIGGDEFLVLIEREEKTTIAAQERQIAKRLALLSARLQKTQKSHGISYGFSTGNKYNLDKLIIATDKKLYQNKATHKHE